jgi:hypothetical protein
MSGCKTLRYLVYNNKYQKAQKWTVLNGFQWPLDWNICQYFMELLTLEGLCSKEHNIFLPTIPLHHTVETPDITLSWLP